MKAITANHFKGGHVLFFSVDNGWSGTIADASLFMNDDGFKAALELAFKDEHEGGVVGVYDLDVNMVDGAPVPVKTRERIRVDGPTTAYGSRMKLEGFYAA